MKKITFGKISSNFGQNSANEPTGTIGTFGPPKAIEALGDDTESRQVEQIMGITSFGKKAKTFDIKEMVEQVKATAKEITKKPEEDKFPENEHESEDNEDDDDDDFIGPPVPNNLVPPQNSSKKQSDESDIDTSDEESDINKLLFVPCSHETQMTHGTKAVTAISVDPSGARLASGNIFINKNSLL